MKTYSGKLEILPENSIGVIGTNPVGINGNPIKGTGGAALWALNNGYIFQGEKLNNCLSQSGRIWGLTTVSFPGKKRSILPISIIEGINKIYQHARENPQIDYYVFYSGNGYNLNGYSNQELAEMFSSTPDIPENIIFEFEFAKLLNINENNRK